MKFNTAFNRPESIETPRGSETSPIFEYRIDKKTGKKILTQTGERNNYELIQASHEATKIENIIKRFTSGDPTALLVNSGDYIDVSELPTSMFEIQDMIMAVKNEFLKLDPEIRAKFDNSPEKYVSMYGSNEFMKLMGLIKEEEIKITDNKKKGEEEVNE